MKNPQTLAEKLYVQFPTAKLKSIKDYSCCALTMMWCCGYEPDDIEALLTVGRMLDKGVLDPDCTVYWDKMSRYLTGRGCNIEKVNIKTISKIKERTPVYFERTYLDSGGSTRKIGHWIGVEKGKIKFNALEDSLCVKEGKPTMARILHFTGDEVCQKK